MNPFRKIKMPEDNEGYHSAYILALIGVLVLVIVFGSVMISNSPRNDQRVIAKDDSYTVTKHYDSSLSSGSDKASSSKRDASSKVTKKTSSKDASKSSEDTKPVTEAAVSYTFPADINTADLGCLCAAEGIGEELAGRIIDYRNSIGVIYNMDLLLEVEGIGEKKLETLKAYFYVSDQQYRDIVSDDGQAVDEPDNDEPEDNDYDEPSQTETVTAPPEEPKQMRKVSINSATAEEIADCLLLDMEQAEKIVALRDLITYFSSPEELILNDTMSKEMILERIDYIIID